MFGHGAKPLVKEENLDERRVIQRTRNEERQANWELQRRTAEEAIERRVARNTGTLFERVEVAKTRITPMPAGAVLNIYELSNSVERDILYLAEEFGKGRKEILRMWTEPRKSTREAYVQEVRSLQAPPEVAEDIVAPVSPGNESPAKKRAPARKKG